MHFNPSEGKTHRLTHILFHWDHYKMPLGVKSGVWIETGQRSGAESQFTPPGRRSCGSSSDCGCVLPTPAARRPSCGAVKKWGPNRETSPESHPPCRAASTPGGAGPSLPGSSKLLLRSRDLQGTGWRGLNICQMIFLCFQFFDSSNTLILVWSFMQCYCLFQTWNIISIHL